MGFSEHFAEILNAKYQSMQIFFYPPLLKTQRAK